MAQAVRIAATGLYAPPHVETAEDLAPRVGKSAEWIRLHTGVARRHIAREPLEALGAKAARAALGDSPPPDLLINASTTPRQAIPDSAVFLARELGWSGIPAFTVHATCLSFLTAADLAVQLIAAGRYRRVLVVSAEIASTSRRFEEPESASLLGDGAAAALFEPSPQGSRAAWRSFAMATHPEGAEWAQIRGAGVNRHPLDPASTADDLRFSMNGPKLFKATARYGAPVFARALDQAGVGIDQIDLFVPHQASGPGLRVLRALGVPEDRVVSIVEEYGNCIAASIPMALATAHADGRLQRGMTVALLGTGAGLSVAAAVLTF